MFIYIIFCTLYDQIQLIKNKDIRSDTQLCQASRWCKDNNFGVLNIKNMELLAQISYIILMIESRTYNKQKQKI